MSEKVKPKLKGHEIAKLVSDITKVLYEHFTLPQWLRCTVSRAVTDSLDEEATIHGLTDAELENLAAEDRFWVNTAFTSEFNYLAFGREVVRVCQSLNTGVTKDLLDEAKVDLFETGDSNAA